MTGQLHSLTVTIWLPTGVHAPLIQAIMQHLRHNGSNVLWCNQHPGKRLRGWLLLLLLLAAAAAHWPNHHQESHT
jgi:hypothetical protein